MPMAATVLFSCFLVATVRSRSFCDTYCAMGEGAGWVCGAVCNDMSWINGALSDLSDVNRKLQGDVRVLENKNQGLLGITGYSRAVPKQKVADTRGEYVSGTCPSTPVCENATNLERAVSECGSTLVTTRVELDACDASFVVVKGIADEKQRRFAVLVEKTGHYTSVLCFISLTHLLVSAFLCVLMGVRGRMLL